MTMRDEFAGATSFTGPATKQFLIVPDDDNDLPRIPRVIYCHVAGTVVVRDQEGTALPYAMQVGDRIDFRGRRVLATGTSGTFYGWI
ncbi:MAG: hypothetical protein AAF582_00210 [Pseudomonadota bacterium]